MECEVKVLRTQSEGRFHGATVTLNNNEGTVELVCSMNQHFSPVKVAVNGNTIKKIIDVRVPAGFVTIIASEYYTNGIKEMQFKNANPHLLKVLVEQMKSVLPTCSSSSLMKRTPLSRGSKMLAASEAKRSGLTLPPLTAPPSGRLSFYSSPSSSSSNVGPVKRISPYHRPHPYLTPLKQKKLYSDDSSPSGFVNLGNSCYLNAMLQSLLGLNCFIADLRAATADSTGTNSLSKQLLQLAESPCRSLLSHIRAILCRHGQSLTAFNEQDAQEVLILCLSIIRNELDDANKGRGCPITKNFEIPIEQQLVCKECGHCGTITDSLLDLTLHITTSCLGVQELLLEYFKSESVEYQCNHCSCTSSELSRVITTPPIVLVITLKRYSHDQSKNRNPITIPPSIDINTLMKDYSIHSNDHARSENKSSNAQQTQVTNSVKDDKSSTIGRYLLHSVISHLGAESENGHYITDVYSTNRKEWLTYSDSVVTPTTISNVVEERRTSAYILFYVQKNYF